MAQLSLEELMVNSAVQTKDPVEKHIITSLNRLRHQNKRLKEHIEKTGTWAHLKDVNLWKPFDFYNYFCTKYIDRYGVMYRQTGNIVLTYHRIDQFRAENSISKEKYRAFIDKAFEKYFNKLNVPRIAHICSSRLYNHIMEESDRCITAETYHALDRDLLSEHKVFEEYVHRFNEA